MCTQSLGHFIFQLETYRTPNKETNLLGDDQISYANILTMIIKLCFKHKQISEKMLIFPQKTSRNVFLTSIINTQCIKLVY